MSTQLIYGKARGILLAMKYLPNNCPFTDMKIVSTLEEWDAIKDDYEDFVFNRVDYPIGESTKNAVEATGDSPDGIPDLIRKVKAQNQNGVVLVMKPKGKGLRRDENDGAFNIIFRMGQRVDIGLVGKGFDGHELTQESTMHEYYEIPWDDMLFIENRNDLMKKTIKTITLTQEKYARQRQIRIELLERCCHYNVSSIEANIPTEYKLIDDKIINKILGEILFGIIENAALLRREDVKTFGVQGNIVEGEPQVWEIFTTERWISKNKNPNNDQER